MGTVGTTRGMRRIASLIWFFHKLTNESLWFSVSGFLAGVELLRREARLSLTGLHNNVVIDFDLIMWFWLLTLDQLRCRGFAPFDNRAAMLARLQSGTAG